MPRNRLLAALGAVVVALAIVVFVVWRDADRPGSRFTIVSGPLGHIAPVVVPREGLHFALRPTDVSGPGRVLVEVGTYLERPKDTITFTIYGEDTTRIARCVFPPHAYRDDEQLACAVPDIAAVRTLRATRTGNAKVALSASDDGTAGFLALEEQRSLIGRVSTVLSRIATPLPNGVGSVIALVGLFGSIALTLFALVLAPRPERNDDDAAGDQPSTTG